MSIIGLKNVTKEMDLKSKNCWFKSNEWCCQL